MITCQCGEHKAVHLMLLKTGIKWDKRWNVAIIFDI